jgi:hypothetical protein
MHTDIHASSGIRTHYPSVRAGEDGTLTVDATKSDTDSIVKCHLRDLLLLFLIESDLTTATPCRNIYMTF